jgi:hypothetical protein
MNTQAFLDQLQDYSRQFEDWWCKPYEKFRKSYMRRNLFFNFIMTQESMAKFDTAVNEFEKEIRQTNDLFEKIFNFLDANYEVYLHANAMERTEIRSAISKIYYPGPTSGIVHYMGNYMEELLVRYVREQVLGKLKATGDEEWLLRGLIAISMENCGSDWRDTLTILGDLYQAAEIKGINPEPFFLKVAEISSDETPRGGSTPMNEMMTKLEWFKSKETE